MDGRRRHRAEGRLRRRPFALRAVVSSPASFSSHLHDLPFLVRVPELRRRVAAGGDRGCAQFRRDAVDGADLRRLRAVPHRSGRAAGRRLDDRKGVRARRAAHGDRDRAQRSRVLYARGRADQGSARPRRCSRSSPPKKASTSARSNVATASCSPAIPQLESRPTFLFFKGAASGLFAEGAKQLRQGVNDEEALLIGIKCERGSHKFFKKYGERFEDSEGKQVFLEFAEEERAHLDLLMREYRVAARPSDEEARTRRERRAARTDAVIDLHTHTTASDGRCSPAELVARAAAAGVTVLSVTDHDTVDGCKTARRRVRAPPESRSCRGSRSPPFATRSTFTCSAISSTPDAPALRLFLAEQRHQRIDRIGRMLSRLERLGMPLDADAILRAGRSISPVESIGRPAVARALVAAGYVKTTNDAFATLLTPGRPGFVPREGASPDEVFDQIHRAGGHRFARASRPVAARRLDSRLCRVRARRDRGVSHESRPAADRHDTGRSPGVSGWACPAVPTSTPIRRTAHRSRAAPRCPRMPSISSAIAPRAAPPHPARAAPRKTAPRNRRRHVAARPARAGDRVKSAGAAAPAGAS